MTPRYKAKSLDDFKEIWSIDFEFGQLAGELPDIRCFCAEELRTHTKIQLWVDEMDHPPHFLNDDSCLTIAYYGLAEMACLHRLNWPLPKYFIDLYVEFTNTTNGNARTNGKGLLGALTHYKLPAMESDTKEEMRQLALRGGPYSNDEKRNLIEYCHEDVFALLSLILQPIITGKFPCALLRGDYIKALSFAELNGIPVDSEMYTFLTKNWSQIQKLLIEEVDTIYRVYVEGSFNRKKFEEYLIRNEIPWPRLSSSVIDLKDETFRMMAGIYPEISPLRELRSAMSQMRSIEIAIGRDGRTRCMLSPFGSKTGRNQPSTTKFVFGPSAWIRNLIKPIDGMALAYIDWSQQEFGIAAALSKDTEMMAAYCSGDPYLAFAKQAGAVPQDATKDSHRTERDNFKQCVLAVQYGMGANSLAIRIKKPAPYAVSLLNLHKKTYPQFWAWSDAAIDRISQTGFIETVFGWNIQYSSDMNIRSARNFPMQANGAEMLRLACIFLVENGVRLCATVHDAVLIEAPVSEIDSVVNVVQKQMKLASEEILDGFSLTTDAKIIKYPDRFSDDRGKLIWDKLTNIKSRATACMSVNHGGVSL
jgi:DNA polymerase-1